MQKEFFRDVLYHLKLDYGESIDIYKVNYDTVNVQTGQRTLNRTKYHATGVKFFPSLHRLFPNKDNDFSYGGGIDVNIQTVLIMDLTIALAVEDFVVFQQKQFELTRIIEEVDPPYAFLVLLKETKGQLPNQVLELSTSSKVNFNQQI